MNTRNITIGLCVVSVLIFVLSGGLYYQLNRPPIPKEISSQAPFEIFVPERGSGIKLISSSYDSRLQVLTIKLLTSSNTSLTVTEQATPEEIASFPDMLKLQFNTLRERSTIDTTNGTAYVASNQDMNGVQISAMNSKGTLMFISASKKMSIVDWREFYNSLATIEGG